jgi:thiamine-monophosphate kinase
MYFNKKLNSFFIKKYYQPEIQILITKKLLKIANSSIDISDGLIADLEKMINNQKYSFEIDENKIPISKNLSSIIEKYKLNKLRLISNGDDYQVLFTATRNKSRIIEGISKILKIKITKIGKIISGSKKSHIIDKKGRKIEMKKKGYIHRF